MKNLETPGKTGRVGRYASGSFTPCNLFIIQIKYRDAWIVFSEKGRRPKFVKRKWKIENNDFQFQTLKKAPAWRMYEERKNFLPSQESKKAFTWLQFDESQQTTFSVFMVIFPPSCNVIKRKM